MKSLLYCTVASSAGAAGATSGGVCGAPHDASHKAMPHYKRSTSKAAQPHGNDVHGPDTTAQPLSAEEAP
jgi:hypothetical protein